VHNSDRSPFAALYRRMTSSTSASIVDSVRRVAAGYRPARRCGRLPNQVRGGGSCPLAAQRRPTWPGMGCRELDHLVGLDTIPRRACHHRRVRSAAQHAVCRDHFRIEARVRASDRTIPSPRPTPTILSAAQLWLSPFPTIFCVCLGIDYLSATPTFPTKSAAGTRVGIDPHARLTKT